MPGIYGIISKRPVIERESLVKSMVSSTEYEPFYDSGLFSIPAMGVYAGWVAHEDSFGTDQPFFNEQRDVVLLFSGECFADAELRADLRKKGHDVSQAAAGWLVHLYEEEGDRFFEKGKYQKRKYFSPKSGEFRTILSAEAFVAEFQETFQRILPRYFESESRTGISLTGGQDSRMIMACLPKVGEKPVCYTFSGENRDTLDALLAAQIANVCGLEHRILRIGRDFFSDFKSHVDRTVYITDGSLGSLGAHEIYLNNRARALSPVRVTGVFGGEILRGVSMFKPLHFAHELVNADLAAAVTSCTRRWSHDGEHPITFAAFHEIPEKRFATPAASRSQTTFRTPYLDNEIVALAYQAPETVRTSIDFTLSLVKANNPSLSKIPTDMGGMGEANRLATAPKRIFFRTICKVDYLRTEGLPHGLSRLDSLFTQLSSALRIAGLHKY